MSWQDDAPSRDGYFNVASWRPWRLGSAGDEEIIGSFRGDRMAGGTGSDTLRGGAGADRLILVPEADPDARDLYDGGAGQDRLTLVLTEEMWLDAAFQQELADFEAVLAGQPDSYLFTFTAFGLTVTGIEELRLFVGGAELSLEDDPVTARADSAQIAAGEARVTGNLLENDTVPDLVRDVEIVGQSSYGTVTVEADGSFTFRLDNGEPAVAALTAGETLTDSFRYRVTDADGDTATAVVTVEIRGPGTDSGFLLEFENPGDSFGIAVAPAGDLNGDGIDDILVGGPSVDENGVVYVIYGQDRASGETFDHSIALADLDGILGFTILGEPGTGNPGYSISTVGDVNGDGIDDIVLGASAHREHGQGHDGTAYVIFGTADGFGASFDLADIDGSNGFEISGASEDDKLGYKVAAAGDVNGDGLADMIVGAYGVDANGNPQSGAAYVVFGRDTATEGAFDPVLEVADLDGSNGFALPGLEEENRTGHSVGSAGDVNGDGIDDLLVGAYGTSIRGEAYSGEVYVVFGVDTAVEGDFAASFDLSSLDGSNGFALRGPDAGDSAGRNVASAGDINGDGIDDILIGGFGYDPTTDKNGTVYVVYGRDTAVDGDFFHTINLATLDGSNGFTIEAAAPEDLLGRSFASLGDINGDGIDDFILGAPDADPGGTPGAGEAYVIFGNAAGFGASFDLESLDGSNGYVFGGVEFEEHAGYAVNSAGDIDGDGVGDIVIGSYGEEFAEDPITYDAYVIYGGAPNLAALDAKDGALDGQIDLGLLTAEDYLF